MPTRRHGSGRTRHRAMRRPPLLPLLLLAALSLGDVRRCLRCRAFAPAARQRRPSRARLLLLRRGHPPHATAAAADASAPTEPAAAGDASGPPAAWIVQWRGEGTEGYSASLRELEFASAFRAELADYCRSTPYDDGDDGAGPDPGSDWQGVRFTFRDALTYRGPVWNGDDESDGAATDANGDAAAEWEGEPIPPSQVKSYESAMQYVSVSSSRDDLLAADDASSFATRQRSTTLNEVFRSAVRRCSLVRTAFRIVAEAETYEDLAAEACANGSFRDLTEGGTNEDATWSIRLRRYSPSYEATDGGSGGGASAKKHARYGKNVRSPLRDERRAILAMGELVGTFRGRVDLASPECGIYLLEGLRPRRRDNTTAGESSDEREGTALFANGGGAGARGGGVAASGKLLARVVARGPKTSIYAPKTRICVTTTPLCPIASFVLCNVARLSRVDNPAILDPFAGSCATLLAAAHIASKLPSKPGGCRSVAIEIAHNGFVNRDDVARDFEARSLPPPTEIIRGDCLAEETRARARAAIGGGAFDVIVTDPPYGIREAMGSSSAGDDDAGKGEEEDAAVPPLTRLFRAMGRDRAGGTPLLKPGGRLVAFVPVRKGESLEGCLPDGEARTAAGLVMEGEGREQVLSDILSRWLVSFVCTC